MNQNINRRDLLKLLGLVSITFSTSPKFLSYWDLQKEVDVKKAPNILILVFDTLSARHMSTFGYQRQTTPNMTKFAEQAIVYHNHYAPANFTSPGTASLLTGVFPWSHRGIHLTGTVTDQFVDNNIFSLLSPNLYVSTYTHNPNVEIILNQFKDHIDQLVPMNRLGLAGEAYSERLFPSDFPIAFSSENIISDFPIAFSSENIILDRGNIISGSLFLSKLIKENLLRQIRTFATDFRDIYPDGPLYNNYGMYFLLEQAIDWIQEQMVSLPEGSLAYYHLWPPHAPYRPRADFINKFDDNLRSVYKPQHVFSMGFEEEQMEKSRQQYDEYLAYVDSEFGRLITFMRERDIFQNTMVILTSDHGELFERGIIGHSTRTLYQNVLRVPLLISLPNQQNRKDIFTLTNGVDLMPTILQFTGKPIPDFIEGQVLPGFNLPANSEDRRIYALEAQANSKYTPIKHCTLAMIKGRYKLIHYLGYEEEIQDELFDLENDPEELENLNKSQGSILKDMKIELLEKLEEANQQYSQ